MADYSYKRITLFAGHYGSGKTNIAVNFAKAIKKSGKKVKIADLDIVNPYFRTKDSIEDLQKEEIELISPAYANTNVDLPALPQEIYGLVQVKDCFAVMDIGGDDRGAYALGRFTPYILQENDYEMVFVVNLYRPLTRTAEQSVEVMREIEQASGIKFTAIINNSNLGNDTSAETVNATIKEVNRLSELTKLPVIFTTCVKEVANGVAVDNVMCLTLQKKYFDIIKEK